jgi:hypothetical protein
MVTHGEEKVNNSGLMYIRVQYQKLECSAGPRLYGTGVYIRRRENKKIRDKIKFSVFFNGKM